mmetsp:Transcript_64118/g.162484  ORF Transcript_64118/g.162484 Transcript_64118/m.162484 type:complete len:357 (-) Transcript_64118:42-1112(-)
MPRMPACTWEKPSTIFAKLKITAVVIANCAKPRPKTSRRMFLSLSKLNSRPISHKKKMIPASAKVSDQWMSEMRAKPEGPMTMPIARNPKTLEATPKRCMRGRPMAMLLSSTSMSRPLFAVVQAFGSSPACAACTSHKMPVRMFGGTAEAVMPTADCASWRPGVTRPQQVSAKRATNTTRARRTGMGDNLGSALSNHLRAKERKKPRRRRVPGAPPSASCTASAAGATPWFGLLLDLGSGASIPLPMRPPRRQLPRSLLLAAAKLTAEVTADATAAPNRNAAKPVNCLAGGTGEACEAWPLRRAGGPVNRVASAPMERLRSVTVAEGQPWPPLGVRVHGCEGHAAKAIAAGAIWRH